jgi:DNA repair protein RecN (Recombination protein N)
MLVELQIRNLAIIDQLVVAFGPGLNVITGETGAGKSIVLDALQLAIGGRASADMVRTGSEAAKVDAVFDIEAAQRVPEILELLEKAGIEAEDPHLTLSREVQKSGRSLGRINRQAVPASLLQAVGRLLVDVHGQGDHQLLLNSQHQLRLLDRFASLQNQAETLGALVERMRGLQRRLDEQVELLARRERELDLIRFQLGEIEMVSPSPGEDEALLAERRVLANAGVLSQGTDEIYRALYGEGEEGAIDQLGVALRRLSELARLDPALRDECDALGSIMLEAEELARRLRAYRDRIEMDPQRLEAVETRLEAITRLKRKYGGSLQAVFEEAERLRARLTELELAEASIDELHNDLAATISQVLPMALEISRSRMLAAETLSARVTSLLQELGMPGGRFVVAVKPRVTDVASHQEQLAAVDVSGIDDVEYLVSLNPGEPVKSLSRVASGGEMARLMLAIKSVLSDVDDTPCLVFDEIDVGVGGRGGAAVGRRLWRLSLGRQVICVTHLPQVAAFADNHIAVTKGERDGRSTVWVTRLDGDERIRELATMLAGPSPGQAAVASALDIITQAESLKAVEGSGVHS